MKQIAVTAEATSIQGNSVFCRDGPCFGITVCFEVRFFFALILFFLPISVGSDLPPKLFSDLINAVEVA